MAVRKRLLWQLFPSYIFIIVLSLVAVSWITFISIEQFHMKQTEEDLAARSKMVLPFFKQVFANKQYSRIDQLCKTVQNTKNTRLTVIRPDGVVLGDSEEALSLMDNHATRPEIATAINGEIGSSIRYSSTLNKDMMYVALPLVIDGKLLAVIRTSKPTKDIADSLWTINLRVGAGGILIAILTAFVSLIVARRITDPIKQLREGAKAFAMGDLGYRLEKPNTEEIAALASSMNRMAEQLSERIKTITEQRAELEAMLAGMIEVVLVVDNDFTVQRLNTAAIKMLGLNPDSVIGNNFNKMVKSPELIDFVDKALQSSAPIDGEITLEGEEERCLSAHGAKLVNAAGQKPGALVVLHDMTRIKKLEKIRKDFVANVSHELKTPITSIKGFVETLLDGAIDDREDAIGFLKIISRHSDRLSAIIDDLLSLSKIEQSQKHHEVSLEKGLIKDVLDAALMVCQTRAKQRGTSIDVDCETGLSTAINPLLLEQAVINLVDNSVKYSAENASVNVSAYKQEEEIVIEVSDNGRGIPEEDLPRIFERFYRVDKARSRKMGGTGLGLAIVKHVAVSHNGRVTVSSSVNQGSTFRVFLPLV